MQTVVLTHNSDAPVSLKIQEMLSTRDDRPPLIELSQAEGVLSRSRVSRVVLILSPHPEQALCTLESLRSLLPPTVLAIGPTSDPRLILQALDAGVMHYADEAKLDEQRATILARLQGREDAPGRAQGRVVCVLGAGGGSGTSTVAANVAAGLTQEGERVALVDLHPGAGDLAALLDLKPPHTLADLCLKAGRIDESMVASALALHNSGICLLSPPDRHDEIPLVTPHGVHKVLSILRQTFPVTVVDLEDCFHEEQVIAVRLAEAVLVVFRPDFTSLRNVRRLLDQLDQLGIPGGLLRLVLNRCGQAKELPAEEVEQVLGQRIAHFVPDDPRTINGANNTGVPAVLKTPGARASQVLLELARSVSPRPAPVPPTPSHLGGVARRAASWLSFR